MAKQCVKRHARQTMRVWLKAHRRFSVILCCCALLLVLAITLVLFFIPHSNSTEETNSKAEKSEYSFQREVVFTTDTVGEDMDPQVLHLGELKVERTSSVNFIATGRQNIGTKATGNLYVRVFFDLDSPGRKIVDPNTTFTLGDKYTFVANDYYEVSWNGDLNQCENKNLSGFNSAGTVTRCFKGKNIFITATEPGEEYNGINYRYKDSDWSTSADLGNHYHISTGQISGGSNLEATIVKQSDIDQAISSIPLPGDEELKSELLKEIPEEDIYIIDSSFKNTQSEAHANPPVGSMSATGTATITSTGTIFTIRKGDLENFIRTSIQETENEEVYDVKDIEVIDFEEISTNQSGFKGMVRANCVISH